MTRSLTTLVRFTITCDDCGFTTRDQYLAAGHSCDVQSNGGSCEDYPCCGHEAGDCNGLRYGSDEAIMAAEYARMEAEDGWGPDWD